MEVELKLSLIEQLHAKKLPLDPGGSSNYNPSAVPRTRPIRNEPSCDCGPITMEFSHASSFHVKPQARSIRGI